MKQHNKIKILFFANIPISNSKSIGGATVLAENILNFIKNDKSLTVTHQQIRKHWNKYGQIIDYILWVFKAPFIFNKHDVISIHATNDFHFTVAPIIWLWAKLLNKKVTYHFFGGIFYEKFSTKNKLHKFLMKKTFLSSETVFLETKMMIENFKKEKLNNLVWLPNTRRETDLIHNNNFTKKFVFISRVTPTKGIPEMLKSCERLTNDYQVDIYGPLDNSHYQVDYFKDFNNVSYKGVLNSQDVTRTLLQYDVLVLPTYYIGEGYPGIIIESLSLGIPVITTKWRALEEIIDNKNGVLIKPKNEQELYQAFLNFNQKNYPNYVVNAKSSFKQFSTKFVFTKLLNAYRF